VPEFHITERDLGFESDNLISYNAGPVNFQIQPANSTIIITNLFNLNDGILLQLLPLIKDCWKISDENILFQDEHKIIVKYNLQIITKYLQYSIIMV